MWCDYLRCFYSFLKIEVDLCFKFDLIIREVLDIIRDFLKETTSALKLRLDCMINLLNLQLIKLAIPGFPNYELSGAT
jgi:hypothetical protein